MGSLLFGALLNVIDVDSAQYANLSMEMVLNQTYLEVYQRGQDYLDKPPLLFWLASGFYNLFGITNLTYKAPSILIGLLSLWPMYNFLKGHITKSKAMLACGLYVSTLCFTWTHSDVKTDALNTTLLVCSSIFVFQSIESKKWYFYILSGLCIALGMMTKGPMALFFPFAFSGIFLLFQKKIQHLFQIKWLITFGTIAILLIPMIWGLYTQFDLHPEKLVGGKTGVSGIRFFFWEQSFGRITGENHFKNQTDPFFLFHSALWLAFPLSVLWIGSSFSYFKHFRTRSPFEHASFLTSFLLLTLLSFSSYKIPHYASVALPFICWQIVQLNSEKLSKISFIIFGVITLIIGITSLFWLETPVVLLFFYPALLLGFWFCISNKKWLWGHVVIGLFLAVIFNVQLGKTLEKHSTGLALSKTILNEQIPLEHVHFLNIHSHLAEFRLKHRIKEVDWDQLKSIIKEEDDHWFYMNKDAYELLVSDGFNPNKKLEIKGYNPNRIEWKFIHPSTRSEALKTTYLVNFTR